MPYWERFTETFPTIHDLANAREEKVLRLWQGLGYYSRARNLHASAKYVSKDLNGVFPNTYSEIQKLKGVGPYTAAAIASICFDKATPVVDGNVFRFASRYFGLLDDISKSGTRKVFEKKLSKVISKKHPGAFNQAMMEFGATVCSPKPKCEECLFQTECHAFRKKIQHTLPVKSGKTKVRDRHLNYLVLVHDEKYYLKERTEKDVWNGLYDFYLIEGKLDEESVLEQTKEKLNLNGFQVEDITEPIVHILSHQKIHARFYSIKIKGEVKTLEGLKSYSVEEMLNLPKPKLIVNYLQRVGIK